jgi:hypothetical protein
MNFDEVMLIIGIVLFFGSLGSMLWPKYRRYRKWRRELDAAVREIKQGIEENNDILFQTGLKRLRKLNGIPEGDE